MSNPNPQARRENNNPQDNSNSGFNSALPFISYDIPQSQSPSPDQRLKILKSRQGGIQQPTQQSGLVADSSQFNPNEGTWQQPPQTAQQLPQPIQEILNQPRFPTGVFPLQPNQPANQLPAPVLQDRLLEKAPAKPVVPDLRTVKKEIPSTSKPLEIQVKQQNPVEEFVSKNKQLDPGKAGSVVDFEKFLSDMLEKTVKEKFPNAKAG